MSDAALPWLYDYVEEARSAGKHFLEKPLMRPAVMVQLRHKDRSSHTFLALVDSGCDHVLAPEWVAHHIGVEPDEAREIRIQIGGNVRRVRFADVTVYLAPPGTEPGETPSSPGLEWQTQVGFFMDWSDPPWMVVLGQCGFFDQFTITMNRQSNQVALDRREEFDERFGVPLAKEQAPPPRFEL